MHVYLYDRSGHTMQAKRSCSQLIEIKTIHIVDGKGPEGDLRELHPGKEFDRLHLSLPSYYGIFGSHQGRAEDKIQATVLQERARRYCQRLVGVRLNYLSIDLSPPTDQNTISAFQNYLLFEILLLRLGRLPWRKQDYLTWALSLMSGIRPRAITVSRGCPLLTVPPWGRH